MATFGQWFKGRPVTNEGLENLYSKTRLVIITGSQPALINYVYDWWCSGYTNIENSITLFADEPGIWDKIFEIHCTSRRLIKLLNAEHIKEKDYGKFREFADSKFLKNTHLIVKEYSGGKVDSMLMKYRPFIEFWNGKFINCQKVPNDLMVDFVKAELKIDIFLARDLVGYCGNQDAIFSTIRRLKASGISIRNKRDIELFSVQAFDDVLVDLLLHEKYSAAATLVDKKRVQANNFIGLISYRLMQVSLLVYFRTKGITHKRELAEQAEIPIWEMDDLLRISRRFTFSRLKRCAELLMAYDSNKDQTGAIQWLVAAWR